MFEPPCCPRIHCKAHKNPPEGFFRKKGYYRAKCRAHPIPRFLCKVCGKSFSRQTFRADYYDKRPDLNVPVMQSLCDGVGYRQSARSKGIRRNNLVAKARKIARHCRALHANLLGRFDESSLRCEFAFDEAETFEQSRVDKPLTLPVLIHQEAFFIVASAVGTLPPRRRADRARRRQEARRRERGKGSGKSASNSDSSAATTATASAEPRRSESRKVCAEVLGVAGKHCGPGAKVVLRTDLKSTYPRLAKDVFGERLVEHVQISSRAPRGPSSPLGRINLMFGILRDLVGRLRRRSWLVSKRRTYLQQHLDTFTCYRNYHRPRFNADQADDTPARLLGFVPRALSMQQILSWRQDFGRERSVHPLSTDGCTVAAFAVTAVAGDEAA